MPHICPQPIQVLTEAYKVIFELFVAFALVLEHDKSEVFHFDRSHNPPNPSIDLGYAPYTGNTPLKPKAFWRYLGFYFDRKLSFHEHVRFYSTKALTTIQAMRMLGNSSRGLLPDQKRTLYRSCVVPVALYEFRMWYYNGARNKGVIKMLTSMRGAKSTSDP